MQQKRSKSAAEPEEQFRGRRFAEQMTFCEAAWRAGNSEAVGEALAWCQVYKQPPPSWVCAAHATIRHQGLSAAEKKRVRRREVHYVRYDAVIELRERKGEFKSRGDDRARTWDHIFAAVSKMLKRQNSFARGEPEMIRRSYKKVSKDIRADLGLRYYASTLANLKT